MSGRQFASRQIEGGAPARFTIGRAPFGSAGWLVGEACEHLNEASDCIDSEHLLSAAGHLRRAAKKLEQAAKARRREREIGS